MAPTQAEEMDLEMMDEEDEGFLDSIPGGGVTLAAVALLGVGGVFMATRKKKGGGTKKKAAPKPAPAFSP
jgi:hypothetical protein